MSDKYCHDMDHPCHDMDKCCPNMNCTGNKKNCSTECCSGLPEEINPNLAMAKSFPILAERIFDCMVLENPQFAVTTTAATFDVTSVPTVGAYADGDPVCVDEICLSFDLISPILNAGGTSISGTVSLCSKTVLPAPVPGSIIDIGAHNVSNHYRFESSRNACCYKHGVPQDGSKCRLIEQNLEFYIYNLKIFVSGKIGCLPFNGNYTATAESAITVLGFPQYLNFFGKICVPNENQNAIIDELFTPCLSIDCVEPLAAGYDLTNKQFDANIESSLVIRKAINVLIEEKLSVLAVPSSEAQHCHGSSVVCEPCHNKCRD